MTKANFQELKKKANEIRKDIIEIAYYAAGAVHLGPSLSCVEVLTVLYNGIMRIKVEQPEWKERDRFILSKGHASPVLYATLAERGFISKEELKKVRFLHSPLEGHPVMNSLLGIDFTSGSLGNGLSAGVGMAYYLKQQKTDGKVFVLLGDGECQEGNVWEAALTAPALGVSNLIAIIDNNGFQSTGRTDEIISMKPFGEKWRAMNWKVIEVNGNDIEQIYGALKEACKNQYRPSVIIANTIKGKGISFMENNNVWHQNDLTLEQLKIARKECLRNEYDFM